MAPGWRIGPELTTHFDLLLCRVTPAQEGGDSAPTSQQAVSTQQQQQQQPDGTQQQPQQEQQDLSTTAAKLVAEIVASPIFYLVAGAWCACAFAIVRGGTVAYSISN